MDLIPQPNSRFVKVKCAECEHEMIVFNHSKTLVQCSNDDCENTIAEPSGGKAILHGEIVETLS